MISIDNIKKPTLLIDEQKCRNNIRKMAIKAQNPKVIFRPHFKTHQSLTIGSWFREENVNSITVSSCTMAAHFANNGWKDITIAFPFNLREKGELKKLTESARINILLSSLEQAEIFQNDDHPETGCFIKINTGYNRSGIYWNEGDVIQRMIEYINKGSRIRTFGFLTHSGHTYKTSSPREITEIYNDTLLKFNSLRRLTASSGYIFSMGDTPSCSLAEDFDGFDEIRPGNFVFYDLTQAHLGSCRPEQIAVAVACPVVEKKLKRKEIIIYGGGVHLSKDYLVLRDGRIVFGKAVIITKTGWEFLSGENYVRSLSQEHGIIEASDELYNNIKTGDVVGVIPVHSCMTADLLKRYHTLDGKIIDDFSPK